MTIRNRGTALGALLLIGGLASSVALVSQPNAAVAQPPDAAKTKPALTSDLALVPGNAAGFVHVEVAKVWKNDAMKPMRKLLEKAGPKAFQALATNYKPAPASLDRVTVVMLPMKNLSELPDFVTILAFNEPFVADEVRAMYMPKAEEKQEGAKSYFVDATQGLSAHFADDKTLVVGDAETLPAFLKMSGTKTGPLGDAIAANIGKPMIACVNLKQFPMLGELEANLPPDIKPLLKAQRITLAADMDKQVTLRVNVSFANESDAKAGDNAMHKAADMARVELNRPREEFEKALFDKKPRNQKVNELAAAVASLGGLAGINTLDEILAELPLARDGTSITGQFTLPEWATQYVGTLLASAGVALPALQRARGSAAQMQSSNNLKQIGLAMHNYMDVHNSFPPAAICDKKGKKLLSWRVAILPYLEQDAVYKQFKLDEPWDSDHNKKISAVKLKVFMDPRLPNNTGNTHYKLFVGKETPFNWLKSSGIANISDGTSNTIMVVAAGDAVPWAKPDDFEFDSTKPLPDLTKPFPQLITAFCDGSVRILNPQMKDFEKIMKILIGCADGLVVPEF